MVPGGHEIQGMGALAPIIVHSYSSVLGSIPPDPSTCVLTHMYTFAQASPSLTWPHHNEGREVATQDYICPPPPPSLQYQISSTAVENCALAQEIQLGSLVLCMVAMVTLLLVDCERVGFG